MNCRRVQELLPLFVGQDLAESQAALVNAHVKTCDACAALTGEYQLSRELTQQFAPPQFSESVYAGIRQSVMREIDRATPAAPWHESITAVFRPRPGWAVATVLLILLSVSAVYFVARRDSDSQSIASDQWVKDVLIAAQPETGPVDTAPIKTEEGPRHITVHAGYRPIHRRRNSAPGISAPKVTREIAVKTGGAEPSVVPSRAASAEKTLRVEMQTANPNIRIIWFAPQHKSTSSSSKGT
jgi:putative zinc finger protein